LLSADGTKGEAHERRRNPQDRAEAKTVYRFEVLNSFVPCLRDELSRAEPPVSLDWYRETRTRITRTSQAKIEPKTVALPSASK